MLNRGDFMDKGIEIEISKDSDERKIWFNGKIVNVKDAQINVLAPSNQFGINVFEGLRAYWNNEQGKLYGFRFNDHINRLLNSAKVLQLSHNYSFYDIFNALIQSIKANRYREDIVIRQTLFLDGFGSFHTKTGVSMFASPIARGRVINKENHGLTCKVSSWERISDRAMPPRIKVGGNYVNSRLAHLEALNDGYDTAIMLNANGHVSESPGACIFIVRNGKVITPPVTASILESITRDCVIDIAKNVLKLEVIERDIDKSELYVSDEIFLTGTTFEIVPVLSVDKFPVNNTTKNDLTKLITHEYFKIVLGMNPDYLHWLTDIYNE